MKLLWPILVFCLFTLNGIAQQKAQSTEGEPNLVFDDRYSYEKVPMFPGGVAAYRQFLKSNLKWPNGDDVQGRVIVSFDIEKDGRLRNFKIERSLTPSFDAEAIRVLRKSPKWLPAIQHGKPVRIRYSLPINFTMPD